MKKKKRKSIVIIIIIIVLILLILATSIFFIMKEIEKKEDERAIVLKDNLTFEFDSNVKISELVDSIEGELIDDKEIDTSNLGSNITTLKYKNRRNKNKSREIEYTIIDSVKPKVFLDDPITITKGSDKDISKIILSGDNCDSDPKREIIGEYDINKVGKYNLKFKIEDKSGNQEVVDFTLKVVESQSSNSITQSKKKFDNIVRNYKNDNTKVGIDVSSWQGNIDWKKVKESGCEFAFIRVGYQKDFDDEWEEDEYFKTNIENAIKNNIDVGIYFHSYAKTVEETKKQAEWVYNKISQYNVKLPIVFDWESWNSFVKCKLSFYDINHMTQEFLNYFKEKGYETSLYSSKYYLDKIWYTEEYENLWLAQYANKADYIGNYKYWQMCNTGRINGIDGDVDIDINYIN